MGTFTEINMEEFPANLEVLKNNGKLGNYTIESVYFLELIPRLPHYMSFPAIINDDTREVVYTTSKEIIEKIRKKLPQRKSKMGIIIKCYVNNRIHVGYPSDSKNGPSQSFPLHLIDEEEFKKLTKENEMPFKWAPGLEADDISPEEFCGLLEPFLIPLREKL